MNGFLTFPIFIAMLLSTSIAHASDDTTYVVSVTQSPDSDSDSDLDPEHVDDGPVRHRLPSKPGVCIITHESVDISSISSEEIYLYDVYDTNGGCIASFTSEQDFTKFLYETTGTIEIRLRIKGYVIHGYLDL